MIKAVLLDFDNTMVGTETGNFTVFKEMMHDRFGHGLKPEDYDHVSGNTWKYIFNYLSYRYGNGATAQEIRDDFIGRKKRYFEKNPPDIAKGLNDILNMPVKRAIVTGSCLQEVMLFEHMIDLSKFDAIVTDELTETSKPEPGPYLKALELLDVPPEEAIALEDSRIGLKSARSAGVCAVFCRQFADEDHRDLADLTVDNMSLISL